MTAADTEKLVDHILAQHGMKRREPMHVTNRKPVKRIHVPSKDALARQMAKIDVDYKLEPELIAWLRPYAAYFGRVANGSKAECSWHAAARQMADEMLRRGK